MFQRITRIRFVRNVAVLASGYAAAQGITIAASPILTRLYDPDAFGIFGLLVSISAVLVTVSGLRYELAIVTASDNTAAVNLLALSCGVVLLAFGLSVAIVSSCGNWIAVYFERPQLMAFLWWLPALLLAGGAAQALGHWFIRKASYKRLATLRVFESLMVVVSQIAAGIGSMGSAGLLGARLAGSFIVACFLAILIWKDDRSLIKSEVKASRIWRVAKENSRFPKYNASQNLISSLSKAAVPFILALFFSIETVGLYWLAERVLRTPLSLVEKSVRTVFYQRASQLNNNEESIYRLYFSTSAGLFLVGIMPLILLLFLGPEIFSIVFGAEWAKAGIYTQWMAAWWFFAFVSGPAVETLTILKLQKITFLFQIVLSSFRVVAIVVGALVGDDITAIAGCSIVGIVFNFVLVVSVLIFVRHKFMLKGPLMTNT